MTKPVKKPTPKMVVVAHPKAGLHTIPFNRVSRGAGNPRTTFDADTIVELAASIQAAGVLHNLLVRPVPHGRRNGYEVLVGERRLRAVALLVEAGTLPADTPLPVRVVDVDDVEALRLATAENVQRDDLHPLDEGAAYARLVAAGDDTKTIAVRVGKTRRHVQLRIALVEKLSKKTVAAFRKGDVTLAQARVLTLVDAKGQNGALERVVDGWFDTAQELKEALTGDLPPLDWAIFDRSLYTGAIVEDPDDPTSGWFGDEPQARRLQEDAIKARAVTLAETYSWVTVLWAGKSEYFQSWEYDSSKDKKKAGAVVAVHRDLTITVHTDLVKKPARKTVTVASEAATTPAPGKTTVPPFTKAHFSHCHDVKTRALQDAIAGNPSTAIRLVCLALLGGDNNVKIEAGVYGYGNPAAGAIPAAVVDGVRKDFGKVVDSESNTNRARGLLRLRRVGDPAEKTEATAWEVLSGFKDDKVLGLLAALVALRCGTFDSYEPTLGDKAIAVTLGAELGVDMATAWRIDADFLEGCRKPALLQIVAGLGITAAVKKDNGLGTAKAIRASIVHHLPKETDYVPPTMRLASRGAILKALAAKPKKGKAQ